VTRLLASTVAILLMASVDQPQPFAPHACSPIAFAGISLRVKIMSIAN